MPRPVGAKWKRLVGMRAYASHGAPAELQLLGNKCIDLIAGLLQDRGFMCPGYIEIYIRLAPSLEDARAGCSVAEGWYRVAAATMDVARFESCSVADRIRMICAAACDALQALAVRDGLDLAAVEAVARITLEHGLDIDVPLRRAQNARYAAKILYRFDLLHPDPQFTLRVDELASGRSADRPLGRHDMWGIRPRFGSLEVMRNQVRIKPRSSFRAQLHYDGVLPPIVYAYVDLFGST